MTYYTLLHKDGTKETYFCTNKEHLIGEAFNGNKEQFQQSVQFLQWSQDGMNITEDIHTGGVQRTIGGADVNPYGWRG